MKPIMLVQRLAFVVGLAASLVIASWLAPDLGSWAGRLRLPAMDLASGLAFVQGVVLLAASGGFLVIAAYAIVTAWRQP